MLVRTSLLLCLLLLGLCLGMETEREGKVKKEQKGNVSSHNKARSGSSSTSVAATARAPTGARSGTGQNKGQAKRTGSDKVAKSQRKTTGPRNDAGCAAIGGICQRNTYVCQGRYLKEKCAGSPGRHCCMPGAWNVFCAGHHHNRVRACDGFGCGAFNSVRNSALHKGVDVMCDDYGNINAPFTGTLGGPVGRRGTDGIQFDGVKLSNSAHCVKIFNIRPHRYTGPISQGETLGYLLPLQDRFSGIASHLELQMCDLSDPTPFI
ncbi:leukocyte cell-derived chemotaxin-2-like isoform X2 [Clupea harengus]|uniref:Leukocyte cell-derived chemotaxin-2-like isoform X2 n=1 Tax=Clupea harengus TaxID=7950 RepID=A0A6P8FZQ4_CLUHA|nr:leukocyte cell-derived chemotaxin-2-like isoform X2 [Clupea harengus]